MVKVFADGGGKAPSDLYYSFKIKDGGKIVHWTKKKQLEGQSTNLAEHVAMNAGVAKAFQMGYSKFTVYCDSQLVVNQINGDWSCNHEHLEKWKSSTRQMVAGYDIIVKWITRRDIVKELLH